MSVKLKDELQELKRMMKLVVENVSSQSDDVSGYPDFQWVDMDTFCKMMNISKSTFHRLKKEKRITVSKLNKKLYVDMISFKRVLDDNIL